MLSLYQNQNEIEKMARMSTLRNNKLKNQNNTINNISNFNNCNYIYLFNNGERFVNKQFKVLAQNDYDVFYSADVRIGH